jgi:hypothetical protein
MLDLLQFTASPPQGRAEASHIKITPVDGGACVQIDLDDTTYGAYQVRFLIAAPYAPATQDPVQAPRAAFFARALQEPWTLDDIAEVVPDTGRVPRLGQGQLARIRSFLEFHSMYHRKPLEGTFAHRLMLDTYGALTTDGYRLHRSTLVQVPHPLLFNSMILRILAGVGADQVQIKASGTSLKVWNDDVIVAARAASLSCGMVDRIRKFLVEKSRILTQPIAQVRTTVGALRDTLCTVGEGLRGKKELALEVDPTEGCLLGVWHWKDSGSAAANNTEPESWVDGVQPVIPSSHVGAGRIVLDRRYVYDALRGASDEVPLLLRLAPYATTSSELVQFIYGLRSVLLMGIKSW